MKLIKISIEKKIQSKEKNYSLFKIENIVNDNNKIIGNRIRRNLLTKTFRLSNKHKFLKLKKTY